MKNPMTSECGKYIARMRSFPTNVTCVEVITVATRCGRPDVVWQSKYYGNTTEHLLVATYRRVVRNGVKAIVSKGIYF